MIPYYSAPRDGYTCAIMYRFRAICLSLVFLPLVSLGAYGRVVRVQVLTQSQLGGLNGIPAYQKITARVFFAVRPGDAANRGIVDVEKAARNANGEVEFSADLLLLRPVTGANGSMLLEIPNRGGTGLLGLLDGGAGNPVDDSQLGDAWLLRQGFTFASLGWQWDIARSPGALGLYAPVAYPALPAKHITGLLRDDFTPYAAGVDVALGHVILNRIGGVEYPAALPEDARNTLTVRDGYHGAKHVIPRSEWSFGHLVGGKLTPSDRFLHLDSGFQPGRTYELVYVVQDPVVAGLGFAAVRDFAAFVKHDPGAIVPAQRVYAAGISQCGRFLRDFLYQGFNADESGRIALDGVLAHVGGAGRGSFNRRFAQPSRDAEPSSSIDWPIDSFPFTDLPERDPEHPEMRARGLLDRATAASVVPKIFFSNTSYEYWGRAESLIHTSADARTDALLSPSVRIYFYSGLQHFSGPFPPKRGEGPLASQQWMSPLPIHWFWRAMVANMDGWVRSGTPPPLSRYPSVSNGTLVPIAGLRFPAIRGVVPPANAEEGWRLDFGPRAAEGIDDLEPPRVGRPFPTLVPQVDADGNDLGGIPLPEVAAPLATYTGWNLRSPVIGAPDQRLPFLGSFVPLPRTPAEAAANHDPRTPITVRYRDYDAYREQYIRSLTWLVDERYILAEDRAAMLDHSRVEWDWAMQYAGEQP